MVLERGPIPAPNPMTTSPKRSNLHNFPFPLKWGSQRYLRCTNSTAAAAAVACSSGSGDQRSPLSGESATRRREMMEQSPARGLKRRGGCDDGDGGIAVVRRKLMHDLKTEADRMKDAILGNGKEEDEGRDDAEAAARPWNLRARRAECKPSGEKKRDFPSPARTDCAAVVRVPKLRSESDSKPPRREKFSVQLTKAEIEEDFMAMTGRRPRARPNKRPKAVQKKLDTLSPGLWLTEVTPDLYKVYDANEKGKGKGKNKEDSL